MSFDHTHYPHLLLMEEHIRDLSDKSLAALNGFVAGEGLMRTHCLLEWTVRIGAWLQGSTPHRVWDFVFRREPSMNAQARDSLIRHMLHGRDASDPRSAGGFNAEELRKVEMKLLSLGCYMPVPMKIAS